MEGLIRCVDIKGPPPVSHAPKGDGIQRFQAIMTLRNRLKGSRPKEGGDRNASGNEDRAVVLAAHCTFIAVMPFTETKAHYPREAHHLLSRVRQEASHISRGRSLGKR